MTRSLIAFVLLFAASVHAQQAPNPAEARLRDALKKLSQRVSTAENAQVTAQAAQLAAEAKSADLTTKLDAATKRITELTKQATADKETTEKTVTGLNTKVAEREKEVARLTEALGKWKEGFEKAKDIANAKENERAEATGKAILMERRATEAERKNAEMYKLGNEILDRYAKFGFGTALLAREPFVGTMRVKFQNYLQDYGDKLETQRIKPGASKAVEASTPATTGKDAKP